MKKGERISIYWEDIKKYYSEEDVLEPTEMYTEGVLLKETKDYVLLQDPETINFNTVKNHPEKKPSLYAIPKGLIKKIETDV